MSSVERNRPAEFHFLALPGPQLVDCWRARSAPSGAPDYLEHEAQIGFGRPANKETHPTGIRLFISGPHVHSRGSECD